MTDYPVERPSFLPPRREVHEKLKQHHDVVWAALTDDQRTELVYAATRLLREMPEGEVAKLREMVQLDPLGWAAPVHFFWGMAARNFLRKQGCADDRYPTGNLDDYYVRAVEEALALRAAAEAQS